MSDQKTKEQDISETKTDKWLCLDCFLCFPWNIDGCPECGSQTIVETSYL